MREDNGGIVKRSCSSVIKDAASKEDLRGVEEENGEGETGRVSGEGARKIEEARIQGGKGQRKAAWRGERTEI